MSTVPAGVRGGRGPGVSSARGAARAELRLAGRPAVAPGASFQPWCGRRRRRRTRTELVVRVVDFSRPFSNAHFEPISRPSSVARTSVTIAKSVTTGRFSSAHVRFPPVRPPTVPLNSGQKAATIATTTPSTAAQIALTNTTVAVSRSADRLETGRCPSWSKMNAIPGKSAKTYRATPQIDVGNRSTSGENWNQEVRA